MFFWNYIWGRYFFIEILKVASLFLICFFGLYTLIDYTNHSAAFHHNHSRLQWVEFLSYYGCEFVLRSEVLIPFALMLATVKTLCKLNTNNELVAMLAGGISIQRLLQPFLFAGLAATVLMYLNNEFILPAAAQERKFMDDMRASHKNQHGHGAQHLILADQSTMIYQHYDTAREQFVDVYWIRSANEVYRMAAMKPYTDPPVGIHVDHIVRDSSHTRSLQASYPEKNFPEISFHKQSLTESVIPPEGMSLTQLWYKLPTDEEVRSDKDARIEATFHRKLASPWLCLLAVIGPAPWCMRFSRQFPVAAVYAAGMFGMVAIYIVLDSAHVLARRQLLDPMWAIWTPLVALTALFGYVYNRTR